MWGNFFFFYLGKSKSRLSRSIAQAVSRRFLTAGAGFASRSVHVGFVVDEVALGQVFLRGLRFYPVTIILPLLHIHSYVIWGMDKGSVTAQFHRDIVLPHRIDKIEVQAITGSPPIQARVVCFGYRTYSEGFPMIRSTRVI
jgi:hypothetical protein